MVKTIADMILIERKADIIMGKKGLKENDVVYRKADTKEPID